MLAEQTYTKIAEVLSNFGVSLVNALIAVIIVGIFFLVGYVIGWAIYTIIMSLEKRYVKPWAKEKGYKIDIAGVSIIRIIMWLVWIFIVLAFLAASAQIVNVPLFTTILLWIVQYIPSLIEGIIILVAALYLSDYVGNIIKKSREIPVADIVAFVVQIFIAYVALVMALPLILPGVDVTILVTAFQLFLGGLALAFGIGLGIAVGFGLKDVVAEAFKKSDFIKQLTGKRTRRRR